MQFENYNQALHHEASTIPPKTSNQLNAHCNVYCTNWWEVHFTKPVLYDPYPGMSNKHQNSSNTYSLILTKIQARAKIMAFWRLMPFEVLIPSISN